ncbi:hypothetical protein ACQHMO_25865, partial [Escherichia coli]|uniref:hypothetical protein n=1 Tax=Escherichia coli TaxID=562 RepID=UPI003CF71B7B
FLTNSLCDSDVAFYSLTSTVLGVKENKTTKWLYSGYLLDLLRFLLIKFVASRKYSVDGSFVLKAEEPV